MKNSFGDFSFDDLNIFNEYFFIGDFSLMIYSGEFSIEFLKNFNEDLFIGDFSLKNSYGDFSVDDLNIFNEDLFIGDFFFEKLRFFLEIFPLKMEICSLSKSEEDEDEDGVKVMKIYS